MAYRFSRNETVTEGVGRIAEEQVERARIALRGARGRKGGSVHGARAACKRLRALIRLLPPSSRLQRADRRLRDAGRLLGAARDAEVLEASVLRLGRQIRPSAKGKGHMQRVRSILAEISPPSHPVSDKEIRRADGCLKDGRRLLAQVRVPDRWATLSSGLGRTYERGRRGFRETLDHPRTTTLHAWRKQAKYTWCHVRLLRDSAPVLLTPTVRHFRRLADELGTDHDLAVLLAALEQHPGRRGRRPLVRSMRAIALEERSRRQQQAHCLGARLYAEKPAAFVSRLRGYWRAWNRFPELH